MPRIDRSKHLIVSLHDTHPGSWSDIQRQLEFLTARRVNKCSILIVPEFHHEPDLWTSTLVESLSQRQNDGYDLVLHGYYHDRVGQPDTLKNVFWTRLYTNHEAEFLDLPDNEAEERIRGGLALFQSHGWQANGFIAPAWLMSPGLPALLRRLEFRYTNRLTELIPLDNRPRIPTQSLCYSTRAAWRRGTSLLWNRALFEQLRQGQVMRLSLHPHDLHFTSIRSQIEELIKTALHDGFQPTTYAEYVAR